MIVNAGPSHDGVAGRLRSHAHAREHTKLRVSEQLGAVHVCARALLAQSPEQTLPANPPHASRARGHMQGTR